ncbi:MAG: Wzz/FepE/Etk N-terminal domain-containing protein [Steroidobacter sp.]
MNANTAKQSLSFGELLGIVRRRQKAMIRTFAIVAAASILLAILWPPTYKASGTILIEQQEVPPDLVRSTITSYADQRIQVITQQVMTSDNLYKIIDKYNLYKKERDYKSREAILKKMRDDIGFNMISADVIDPRSGNPTKATIAFEVSFKNGSPDVAAHVANELVSLYLQLNIESRKERTADAATFLTSEADRLDKRINELQSQIARFKEQHTDELPDLTQLNIQLMNRADDELRDTDNRIRSLDQQGVYLQAQLAQISPSSQVYTSTGERVLSPHDRLKYLRTEYARVSGLYSPTHPDVIRLKREIASLEKTTGEVSEVNDLQRQLEAAKTQLAEAQQKYSPDHPDIIRLNHLIASLQTDLDKANKQDKYITPDPAQPDNPAYIQIKAQMEATQAEKASLQLKKKQLESDVADYEKRLADAPAVERQYSEMARELESDQLQYRVLSQKQMEAQSAENLETERKGERFTLIEPPLTPTDPYSPNRVVILVLGVVLAIGGAVGLAAVRETLDTSIRNRRDLESLLNVPPLAIVPWIETAADRAVAVRNQRITVAGSIGLLVIMLAAVHLFYRPLDVLWMVLWRRLGV